ncbi:NAD(P)-dependent alcohol dehydrogenase [Micromonospora sp. SH-82]|uniref:NAD(P)-dependent alcohol dehydrogenase n=1 Tax=Micromonospora sp. SH-82 TaxID=3132938 RepID=UPI003EB6BDE1
MRITAAVLDQAKGPFTLQEIDLADPGPDEVLVRVDSVGICGTDLEFATFFNTPAVLGHEGSGVVEQVGDRVTGIAVGDHVTMSFASCGSCPTCLGGHPAYCHRFDAVNFSGRRPDGTSALSRDGETVNGHFLGQSSFASHVVAPARAVVPIDKQADLRVVAPFGCGFGTGAGAVLNVLRPPVGSSLVVFGAGAVGVAAIMAAKVGGCATIAAVDVNADKLDTARLLGATHGVHSATEDPRDLLRAIAPYGFDFAIDTTGREDVLRTAVESLGPLGRAAVVGVGPSEQMSFDWRSILNGRTVTGVIGGDSLPQVFLPRLIDLHAAGRFPVDRLLTHFPFEQINEAVAAVRAGAVGKAVLTF